MRDEARLRGRERNNSSTTIRPRLCQAKPAWAGESGIIPQRPYALGYARRSPPARAIPDYLFKDHTPSAMQGEACLRGLWRIISQRPSFRSPRGKRDVHCGCPSARFRRSVDRNSFRSPRGKCDVHCGCPGSVRPYPSGITRRAARSSLRVLRLPAIPRTLPVLPPVVVLRASRRRAKRALLPAARARAQNRRRCR